MVEGETVGVAAKEEACMRSACASIRQHTSAYLGEAVGVAAKEEACMRSACVSISRHTSATSAYVSILERHRKNAALLHLHLA